MSLASKKLSFGFVVFGLVFVRATPALAQELETARSSQDAYASGFIDRPLLLPRGRAQAGLTLDISNIGSGDTVTGEAVGAAFDIGVADRLQLGAAASFPVNPAAFGSFIANVQVGLGDAVAARLDTGLVRGTFLFEGMSSDAQSLYVVGLGAPVKLKLARGVALTSGRTSAAGFGKPLAAPVGSGGIALGANPLLFGDELVAITINEGGTVSTIVQAPIGILLAPVDRFAIALRGGYRYIIPASGSGWSAAPFGGDLMVNLSPVDVGVSADVAGLLDARGGGYFDYRQFTVWMQARF